MASTKISNLTGQTSVGSGDLFVTAQEDATNKKITGLALKKNVLDYMTGDVTADADGVTTASTAAACTGNSATVTNGVYTTSKISVLAATSSSELAGVISDETGSGALVFGTSPTLTGGTMGGTLACADNLVTRPKLKDVAEEVNAIAGTPTAAFNVDLEDGNVQTVTFGAGTYNVGLTNALTSKSASLTLITTNLATSGTKTFLSGAHDGGGNAVKWAGGAAPTFTASGVDILAFTTVDGGTNWYGFLAGAAMA